MGRRKLTMSIEEIISLYASGKSTVEIADQAGVTYRYISSLLKQNGVQKRNEKRPPKYKVNTEFFKRWSHEMAYVLGFILTDGHVAKNTLVISQKDYDILHKIREAMGSDATIRKLPNGNSYLYNLYIYRKEIVQDLAELGIAENKSRTVGFPAVPAEYMPSFIRGVIDGDGWVQDRGYVMNVTSASPEFSHKLCEVFKHNGFNSRVDNQNGIYRIWVSGKDDIQRLASYLYEDAGVLFLERKRDRFYGRREAV